jgi:predicted DNA-binding transcriptional regulator AlpA
MAKTIVFSLIKSKELQMESKIDIRDKLFRIEDVSALTTFAKSTIWVKVSQGKFPKPFKLPSSSICLWRGSDLFNWIDIQSTGASKESQNG